MLKREYVVPLRRKAKTAPKWRRSKKSIVVLKDFIKKHMKSEGVIVCKELNETIWENGSKNPPGKVKVIAVNIDVKGETKSLVNLASIGIDKHLELYKAEPVSVVDSKVEEVKDLETVEKEDTSVQEVEEESTEVKEEETKEKQSSKTTSKKQTDKKEVKKDE